VRDNLSFFHSDSRSQSSTTIQISRSKITVRPRAINKAGTVISKANCMKELPGQGSINNLTAIAHMGDTLQTLRLE